MALLLLGGFQVVLGLRDLPNSGLGELLLGGGLLAVGAMGFAPPARKSLRTTLGVLGVLLAVAGLVLTIIG